MRTSSIALCTASLILGMTIAAIAKPSKTPDRTAEKHAKAMALFEKGKKYAAAWKYEEATTILKEANKQKPNDPDILNMLAYSQRNSGKLEIAIANYHKALNLRTKFPEAREYLGEAYVQGAVDQIKLLDSYGATEEKKQVIAKLLEAADVYHDKESESKSN